MPTIRTIVIVKGKLIQESLVVLVKLANVADLVNHHGKPFHAEPCRETRVLFGINACLFQHIGIDHATTKDFEPPATEKDIDFHTRLGKRKVAATVPNFNVRTEHAAQKVVHRTLQMSQVQVAAFFECENFDLVKDQGVGGVNVIAAVNAAGGYDPERWLALL
jgi:hypothetical protein